MLGVLTGFSLSLAQSFGGSLLGLLTGFSLSLAQSFPSTSFVRLLDGGFSLLLSIFSWCSLSGVRHANDPHGWRGTAAECPTPAFSGAAGDLHRPARALVRHEAPRSRPAPGPRQRRPLQSTVGHSSLKRYINNTSQIVSFYPFFLPYILHFHHLVFYYVFISFCKTFTPRLGSRLFDGLFSILL